MWATYETPASSHDRQLVTAYILQLLVLHKVQYGMSATHRSPSSSNDRQLVTAYIMQPLLVKAKRGKELF